MIDTENSYLLAVAGESEKHAVEQIPCLASMIVPPESETGGIIAAMCSGRDRVAVECGGVTLIAQTAVLAGHARSDRKPKPADGGFQVIEDWLSETNRTNHDEPGTGPKGRQETIANIKHRAHRRVTTRKAKEET